MPDLYAIIGEVDPGDPGAIGWHPGVARSRPDSAPISTPTYPRSSSRRARGCSRSVCTGPATRVLARSLAWPRRSGSIRRRLVAKARELGAGLGNLAFEEGDGRALRFAGGEFDVVVFHTTLSDVPQPGARRRRRFGIPRPAAHWWSSTGTTPRSPWRWVSTTRYRIASRR